jgi:hypothetical protein
MLAAVFPRGSVLRSNAGVAIAPGQPSALRLLALLAATTDLEPTWDHVLLLSPPGLG